MRRTFPGAGHGRTEKSARVRFFKARQAAWGSPAGAEIFARRMDDHAPDERADPEKFSRKVASAVLIVVVHRSPVVRVEERGDE